METRDQILQVARHLIQTRSYLGFSFQDVADRIGIRKPSLYHHFPSKEALGVAVLNEATRAFNAWSRTIPDDPAQQLPAYFSMYRKALQPGRGICPAGALAPGWDCIDANLRHAVRELRSVQIDWLAGVLQALEVRAESAELAAFIFTVSQGALLSARMTGSAADFDAAVELLQRAISTHPTLHPRKP